MMLKKSNKNIGAPAYWCIVNGSDVALIDGELPLGNQVELGLGSVNGRKIGTYQNRAVLWLDEAEVELSPEFEERFEMVSLRELLDFSKELFLLISRAIQFGHMSQTMRFCPQCGGRNHLNHNQLAMQCGDCRTLHYPRIFPCIIVAVRKGDSILLAQHPRHKGNMYTVIAGFLEVGETLEQCVAREVLEETGITVTNVRYHGSQPWAFPSSMMMGFLADYDSGEVKPDYSELSDAAWFKVDELPEVAPKGTIARELIETTVELASKEN